MAALPSELFPPREEPEPLVGFLIKRLQHSLRRALDEGLRDLGLNTAHYVVLRELEAGPLSAAELARRAFVRPQAMAPLLEVLEERGLLVRSPHLEHRRVLEVRLTPRGRELLSVCQRRCEDLEERLLKGLGTSERESLLAALRHCLRNMGS
ncbi:MAG TPA: MarR family transcriptional regulator [Candidatus Dormibacteraeota bacterium]|jgi:DNA-binding MarR family transcriptional regulator|nr:MarR family transcriptional regulator [Candidatus Dormibacteraeota bacterium]